MSREVRHDGRGALQIRFAFDRRLVDLVKTVPGRRWNPAEKYWSAPEDVVVELVDLLLPEGFGFDDATRGLYQACGGTAEIDPRPATDPSGGGSQPGLFDAPGDAPRVGADDLTVSRLNERVRDVLQTAFPAPLWIVGEISGFNKAAHRRHVGFQLVERDADGRVVSEVNATVFESTRAELEAALAAAGDPFRLEDEIQVRIRVRVELYVPWGSYRVIVEELDVRYTLGEAARRREEIVRRLTADGLIELNRSMPFPALPQRVGLITSLGSDAFNDVLRTLQESGYAFRLTAHGARVQGRQTEPSVLNALDRLRRRADRLDVVLICRGGGSRTDLAWFDSEALGRAVAGFPLPVVIGIGHEQDASVLDAVGWSCKTPTAAAALLVDTIRDSMERLDDGLLSILERAGARLDDARATVLDRAGRLARAARDTMQHGRRDLRERRGRLARGARVLLESERRELAARSAAVPRAASTRVGRAAAELAAAARQLLQGARRDVAVARRRVEEQVRGIAPAALRHLRLHEERTGSRLQRLRLADPRRVVERGFAILRGEDGTVTVDAATAPPGTKLRAELRRGTLRLRSEGADDVDTKGSDRS